MLKGLTVGLLIGALASGLHIPRAAAAIKKIQTGAASSSEKPSSMKHKLVEGAHTKKAQLVEHLGLMLHRVGVDGTSAKAALAKWRASGKSLKDYLGKHWHRFSNLIEQAPSTKMIAKQLGMTPYQLALLVGLLGTAALSAIFVGDASGHNASQIKESIELAQALNDQIRVDQRILELTKNYTGMSMDILKSLNATGLHDALQNALATQLSHYMGTVISPAQSNILPDPFFGKVVSLVKLLGSNVSVANIDPSLAETIRDANGMTQNMLEGANSAGLRAAIRTAIEYTINGKHAESAGIALFLQAALVILASAIAAPFVRIAIKHRR